VGADAVGNHGRELGRLTGLDQDGPLAQHEHHRSRQHGEAVASEVPHLGDDWTPRLTKAGFTIEAERTFTIDLRPPLPAAAGRYAQATLRRIRSGLDGRMSDGDLATLDTL
jgi:hypothetical protein